MIMTFACGTVKKHRGRIYQTLGVENAASAIKFYLKAMAVLAEETALQHVSLCPACLEQMALAGSLEERQTGFTGWTG